jgi:hypothetical protein
MHLEALYHRDRRGRLASVNEWDGGAAPRFHLMKRGIKSVTYQACKRCRKTIILSLNTQTAD